MDVNGGREGVCESDGRKLVVAADKRGIPVLNKSLVLGAPDKLP
jgi:hypothetical protein